MAGGMSPTVEAIGAIPFEGNITPDSWFTHPLLKTDKGRINLSAIVILADVVYWYRPSAIRDETTNQVTGYEQRFKADMLQMRYSAWAAKFGLTLRQVKAAVAFLKQRGILKVEHRTIKTGQGKRLGNVTFVEPIPEKVKQITQYADPYTSKRARVTQTVGNDGDSTPLARSNVQPLHVQTYKPSHVQTYKHCTEITTSTENSVRKKRKTVSATLDPADDFEQEVFDDWRLVMGHPNAVFSEALEVHKKGWVIVDERDLIIIVPADPGENPVRIIMQRLDIASAPIRNSAKTPDNTTAKPPDNTNAKPPDNTNAKPPDNTNAKPPDNNAAKLTQVHKLMDVAPHLNQLEINDESLKRYQTALSLARDGKFQQEEMEGLSQVGMLQMILGDYAQARDSLKKSQALAVERRSSTHFNRALLNLGDLERQLGNNYLARQHYNEARVLYQREGDQLGEANVLLGQGEVEKVVGNVDRAREHFNDALGLYQKEGDRFGQANVLLGLGSLELVLLNFDRARQHFVDARGLFQKIGSRLGEATALVRLGNLEWVLREYDRARQHFNDARGLSQSVGSRAGEAEALRGLGDLERVFGNYEVARQHFNDARAIFRKTGDWSGEATALRGLGDLEWALRDYDRARQHLNEARGLFQKMDSRAGEAVVLWRLGDLEQVLGNNDLARQNYDSAAKLFAAAGLRDAAAECRRLLDNLGKKK